MNIQAIGVYRIVSPNGSCYIGATTVSFSERWKSHLKDFKYQKTKCSGLLRAFEKYGPNNMTFEILEIVSPYNKKDVWAKEVQWWNIFKSKDVNIYNGKPSGTGSVHHTKDTKSKIGSSVRERAETKINARWKKQCKSCKNPVGKGRERSIYCVNCAGTRNRKPLSEEHKSKISKSLNLNNLFKFTCKGCYEDFETKRNNQSFCSRSCIIKVTNKLRVKS